MLQRCQLGQDSEPGIFEQIWSPVKEVLETGADIFSKVYPVATGQVTGYPSPYPQTPDLQGGRLYGVTASGYPTGSTRVLPTYTAAPTDKPLPAWFWPAVAGIGGFVLISTMKK